MKFSLSRAALFLPLFAIACAGADDSSIDDEEDLEEATDAEDGAVEADISVAGRWVLPSAVKAAGRASDATFNGAPSWSGGRNCSGTYLAGVRTLASRLKAQFPQISQTQGYNCRQVRGGSTMSMHGTGRAVDIFFPLSRKAADNTKGDPVANWLVTNSEKIGVQYVIWDRTEWKVGAGASSYGGKHPHHDHIHLELNIAGANKRTAYF